MSPSVSTGVAGLDAILRSGLPAGMVYLVHGGPGSGKTTLGFQFLREGVRRKERVLFASLLQRRPELERIVASHGWNLEGIDLLDIPAHIRQSSTEEQTMFSPGEVELQEVTETIIAAIHEHRPQRLVFDSITELAVLVDNPLQLRRLMLKFKERLDETGCTSLFTANDTMAVDLPSLQTAVHGVIELGSTLPPHGAPRRWLEVTKMRGLAYSGGRHDFRLQEGGLEVYPRLEVPTINREPAWKVVSSGNAELDSLFGGGLESGTACLIKGTTGVGKSTLAALYVQAAAERGERSIMFCFDERRQTFIRRAKGLGLDIERYIDNGLVQLHQIDYGTLSLGAFIHYLREAVDEQHVSVVVIDSVSGFFLAVPETNQIVQLHELLTYLGRSDVLTLMLLPTHGLGDASDADIETNASYIADTVVLMRHFEAVGDVRRCISVLKKRHGDHERSIREIRSGRGGVKIGPPLTEFRNVLSGTPEYVGQKGSLLANGKGAEVGD